MVERHSAEIEMESAPGQGTTVRLTFPITTAVEALPFQAESPLRPAQRLRILLVDDDPLLIKSLRDTLESDGHLVTVADGGQAGIDTFQTARQRGETLRRRHHRPRDALRRWAQGGRDHQSGFADHTGRAAYGWGQRLVAEGDIPPHVDRVLNKPPKLRDLRRILAELTSAASN